MIKSRATILICALLAIATFIYFGSVYWSKRQALAGMSDTVRISLASQLQKLQPVNFDSVIGHKPTLEQVELGRLLFNDVILSRNNDTSCATCHLSNHGFATGDPLPIGALGFGGPTGERVGRHFAEGELSQFRNCGDDSSGFICQNLFFRNTISTVNVAYRLNEQSDQGLLWDGRFGRLEFQTLLPIHTREELCGSNPVPSDEAKNPFRVGGALFKQPVLISHSHSWESYTGANFNLFNAPVEEISGIPSYRPNGTASIPSRNECLAIAVAKVRSVPKYKSLFKQAYQKEPSDLLIGMSLASYLATQVSNRTPYDKFIEGKNSLTESQLRGLVAFMTSAGETRDINGMQIKGAGCIGCHAGPTFGGKGFASLGVISDPRSLLTRPEFIFRERSAFLKIPTQRNKLAPCHREGRSVTENGQYGPDMGRAAITGEEKDCFQFRIPALRNIIETAPYFHHGTARGQGVSAKNYQEQSLAALRQVIEYHLRGPQNPAMMARISRSQSYFDPFFQRDEWIPFEFTQFSINSNSQFPIDLSKNEVSDLLDFVAFGLYDPQSTTVGALGNDVGHPKQVPSGFEPLLTRDQGTQFELPPNSEL